MCAATSESPSSRGAADGMRMLWDLRNWGFSQPDCVLTFRESAVAALAVKPDTKPGGTLFSPAPKPTPEEKAALLAEDGGGKASP